jgi:type VI secretion system protein ImpG
MSALRRVDARPLEQLVRGVPIRGVAIDVTVEDRGFPGAGEAYLFGAVLERFFSHYAGINSFSRTTLHTTPSNVTFSWPARNGSHTLL